MAKKSTKLRANLKGLFSRTEEENAEGAQPQAEVEKHAETTQSDIQETPAEVKAAKTPEKAAEPVMKAAPAKKPQKPEPKSKTETKPEEVKPVSKEKAAVPASGLPDPKPLKKQPSASPSAEKPASDLAVKQKAAVTPKANNSAALVKKEEAEEREVIHQMLVFTIDGDNYGVSVLPIRSIIKPLPVFIVPGTPKFIKGLINLRGEVIPVFDLRTRFGLPEKDFSEHTRFVVVETQEKVGGLVVDEIKGVKSIPESCFGKPSKVVMDIDNRYLRSVANFENEIILVLDLEETFLIPEQRKNN